MANTSFVLSELKRKNAPGTVITQSFLRSDVILGTSGPVNFAFLQNQSIVSAKEVRLQPSDAFCVTSMALKIYKSADTTGLTNNGVAITVDYSYPNPAIFTGANEAVNLENLFNGYLSLVVNKSVIYSAFPAYKFRRVNTTQLGVTSAAIAGPVQYKIPTEEQAGVNNGLVSLEPTINLMGSWNLQFTLNCPGNLNLAGTSSTNVCSLILDGFLLQNAAEYIF